MDFDTSSIAKFYFNEPESPRVASLSEKRMPSAAPTKSENLLCGPTTAPMLAAAAYFGLTGQSVQYLPEHLLSNV